MPRAGRRKRLLSGESACAYCGRVPADTVDHVIPKALFLPPLPLDMITVPACSSCNLEKSKYDVFLRDHLVSNVDLPANETADRIRTGPYQRAVGRKQSELWKEIQSDRTKKTKLSDEMGNYLGMYVEMSYSHGPMKKAIIFIVKGLYYRLLDKRIPENHSFLVGGIPSREDLLHQFQKLKSLGQVGSAKIGDNTIFVCFCQTYCTDEEAVAATLWGLIFYDRTYMGCLSVGPNLRRQTDPAFLAQY